MKIQGWLNWFREHALPQETVIVETVTDHVGDVSRTTERRVRIPRKAKMDEIDRLLAAARGVKLDTEVVVKAHAVSARGDSTTIEMECADCNERCNASVKTTWLTSQRAGDLVEWQCAKCGLQQMCSISPQ